MANTFVKLATITVGSGGSSGINFVGIPQTYTDLCVKISARTNRALVNDEIDFTINNDSGTNYSYRVITGSGTAASSTTETSTTYFRNINNIPGATSTSSVFGSTDIYFCNYTSSNAKAISSESVGENNDAPSYMDLAAYLYSGTAPITSLQFFPRIGPLFVQYSTATLYGIKNS